MEIKILKIENDNNCITINKHIIINLGKNSINTILQDGYDLTKIDTVIFTNIEENTISDYPLLIVSLEKLGVRNKINVYYPEKEKNKIEEYIHKKYDTYFDAYIEEYITYIEITDKKLEEKEETYKFIQTTDSNYGLIINDKIGITGNTPITDGVKEIYQRSDLVMTDCGQLEGDNQHMGIDDLVVLSAQYTGVKIIPINMTENIKEELKNMKLQNVIITDEKYTCYIN